MGFEEDLLSTNLDDLTFLLEDRQFLVQFWERQVMNMPTNIVFQSKLRTFTIELARVRDRILIVQATQPIDDEPVLIPVVPPVLEQTKVFGLTLKQIAVLIGIGVLIL